MHGYRQMIIEIVDVADPFIIDRGSVLFEDECGSYLINIYHGTHGMYLEIPFLHEVLVL